MFGKRSTFDCLLAIDSTSHKEARRKNKGGGDPLRGRVSLRETLPLDSIDQAVILLGDP